MKKIITLSTLLFTSLIGYSQIVNSNKTTLAQYYDGDVNRVELNGAKIATQFRLKKWKTPFFYKSQPEIKSSEKNNAVFFNLGATNTSSFLNLNKLEFKENNGYTLGIEYQNGAWYQSERLGFELVNAGVDDGKYAAKYRGYFELKAEHSFDVSG